MNKKTNNIIIVGAPRSGTNMLRDSLTQLDGVGSWPCDEINYIWRHGNIRHNSDVFTPQMATDKVQHYIQRQFDRLASTQKIDTIIEKTCANSLRIDFVNKIFPDAKYIFIVRDGMDVVGSAVQRWKASLDIPYLLQKVRYVPPSDLPYYAMRYFYHHLYRAFSKEKRLAVWGPVMEDMESMQKQHSLLEVCALQWQACVNKAEKDLSVLSPEKIIRVKYEDFVSNPVAEFSKITTFIDKSVPDQVNRHLQNKVTSNSIGKGRNALGDKIEMLQPLIKQTLERHGYE